MPGLQADHAEPSRPAGRARPAGRIEAPAGQLDAPAGQLDALGPGAALDPATRALMEARLGWNLADVRVHTDDRAASAAGALGARAFTVGRDVVFARDAYAPHTDEGRGLLTHELVHTVQQRSAPPGPAGADRVAAVDDPLELEARQAAGAGAPVRVRPAARRAAHAYRDVVLDPVSHVATGFEFRVGTELELSFVTLAQRLLGGGALHERGLSALREEALRQRGTVDDHERMFMAGLTDPANAARLAALPVQAGAAVTFPLASIRAGYRRVADLGREAVPATVTAPLARAQAAAQRLDPVAVLTESKAAATAAEREIRARATNQFAGPAAELVAYAGSVGVPLTDVLAAMLAAASDSSPGDRVFAGIVYAIAAAAGHSTAPDILAGRVKVDALVPTAFARLPAPAGFKAFYVTTAQKSGAKGDTVYVMTTLDVTDLPDRSTVVHELTHVEQDRGGQGLQGQPTLPTEAQGYLAQGRYLLEQVASAPAAERAGLAGGMAMRLTALETQGMLIEALNDRARYEPVMVLIGAAAQPAAVPAATIKARLNLGAAALTKEMSNLVTRAYQLQPGQVSAVNGLTGESVLDLLGP